MELTPISYAWMDKQCRDLTRIVHDGKEHLAPNIRDIAKYMAQLMDSRVGEHYYIYITNWRERWKHLDWNELHILIPATGSSAPIGELLAAEVAYVDLVCNTSSRIWEPERPIEKRHEKVIRRRALAHIRRRRKQLAKSIR